MNLQLIDNKVVIKGKKSIVVEYNEIDSVVLKTKKNRFIKYILLLYLFAFLIVFSSIYISGYIMIAYVVGLCYLLFYKMKIKKIHAVLCCKEERIKIALHKGDLDTVFQLIDLVRLNKFKKYTAS